MLEAARDLIRQKGYSATTVDDVCTLAGVTKGSFFHHFESKEHLGVAAAEQFGIMAESLFDSAPYHQHSDPLDRVLGYVDFRMQILGGEIYAYTCLLGTMVQEVHSTHPELRAECNRQMSNHIDKIVKDVEEAKRLYAPDATWTAESVGYFIQTVLQGAFVYSKVKQGPEVAHQSLMHLRRYLETLFEKNNNK